MKKAGFVEVNPFVVGRYAGDEFFCDRERETAELQKQIGNGRNVTLIAPRRMGKTGLIQHFFNKEEIKERYYTFFVDIYATSTLEEFIGELGRAIFRELKPKGKRMLEAFFNTVKSLQFGFKVDAMSGEPSFQLSSGSVGTPEITIEEIFQYLDSADKPCIVALDEFQQVAEYKGGNAEALLRSHIQRSGNASFIFAGSRRHMMLNMFRSANRPFYNSSITISLGAIPLESYLEFVSRMMSERGRTVCGDAVKEIYDSVDGTTWYMQLLMNEGYAITAEGEELTSERCRLALDNIIAVQQDNYSAQIARLTARQRDLLMAIASDGKVGDIMSAGFIRRHEAVSASSVQAALKALLREELVWEPVAGTYCVSDYFMAVWLRERQRV